MKHHSIVWADDDQDDLSIVREVLREIDDIHQLKEAADGRQVIDYLNGIESPLHLPCLIVLDINMPLLNGKETLALIRREERYKEIAVVVFTTSSNERDRLFCEGFGVQLYTKPATFSEYRGIVSELLRLCPAPATNQSSLN